MIIANFTKNISEYTNLGKEICVLSIYGCSTCGYEGKLHRHGYYHRNVITKDIVTRIPILRVKCPSCKKTEGILPSFLIPYYQYSFDFIFQTLYLSYVTKASYRQILGEFYQLNPRISFSASIITSFKKRMKRIVSVANSFFCHFHGFYYAMDSSTEEILLTKIHSFMESLGDFNHRYFQLMPKYFFSKT